MKYRRVFLLSISAVFLSILAAASTVAYMRTEHQKHILTKTHPSASPNSPVKNDPTEVLNVALSSAPKAKSPILLSLTVDGLDTSGAPNTPDPLDQVVPGFTPGTKETSLGSLFRHILNAGSSDLAPVKVNASLLSDTPPVSGLGNEPGVATLFKSDELISTPVTPGVDLPPTSSLPDPSVSDPVKPLGDDQVIANLNIPDVQLTANAVPVVALGTVSAVPELSTWTLMIAGFGIVGGVLRRRRRLRLDL